MPEVRTLDTYRESMAAAVSRHSTALIASLAQLAEKVEPLAEAASLLIGTLQSGHKILAAGNGGSAAEAQHFAAELVGRFKRERAPYAALALTADTSILTAVANDYSYDDVFARQVMALGRPGDLFLAFSTSGESSNLVRAAEAARRQGMAVLAVTGSRPSRLEQASDLALQAPAADTAIVQEIHTMITHFLCDLVEEELA